MMSRTAPVSVKIHQLNRKMIIKPGVNIKRFTPTTVSTRPTKNRVMDFRFSGFFIRPGSKVPNANMTKTSPRLRAIMFQV